VSEKDYSKWSGPAVRVLNSHEQEPVAGQFCYVVDSKGTKIGLQSCLPNAGNHGEPNWGSTMFKNHGTKNREWVWDGNVEKPTLSPSIHRVGHWHGHLKKGYFKSCK
jgi:hypothetical protein